MELTCNLIDLHDYWWELLMAKKGKFSHACVTLSYSFRDDWDAVFGALSSENSILIIIIHFSNVLTRFIRISQHGYIRQTSGDAKRRKSTYQRQNGSKRWVFQLLLKRQRVTDALQIWFACLILFSKWLDRPRFLYLKVHHSTLELNAF